LAACRTVPPAGGASAVKIIGGSDVLPADPAYRTTVALVRPKPFPYIFCTGTLIGAHAVLTAAHCAAEPGDRIAFGAQTYKTTPPLALTSVPTLKIENVVSHYCYAANKQEWDLAVVSFGGDIPPEYGPPVEIAPDGQIHRGTRVLAAGFGQYSRDNDRLDGKLRQVQLQVVTGDDLSPLVIGALGINGDTFSSTCHGDSGGSLYLAKDDGNLQLLGVVQGAPAREQTTCYDVSLFENAPRRAAWIAETMAGTPPVANPSLCASTYDAAKLPPPFNDDKRGPPDCRLDVQENVETIHIDIKWVSPPNYDGDLSTPIGQKAVFSAPIQVTRLAITGPGGAPPTVLQPVASGKGRNCFVHQPSLPLGASSFSYQAISAGGVSASVPYVLRKQAMNADGPP